MEGRESICCFCMKKDGNPLDIWQHALKKQQVWSLLIILIISNHFSVLGVIKVDNLMRVQNRVLHLVFRLPRWTSMAALLYLTATTWINARITGHTKRRTISKTTKRDPMYITRTLILSSDFRHPTGKKIQEEDPELAQWTTSEDYQKERRSGTGRRGPPTEGGRQTREWMNSRSDSDSPPWHN